MSVLNKLVVLISFEWFVLVRCGYVRGRFPAVVGAISLIDCVANSFVGPADTSLACLVCRAVVSLVRHVAAFFVCRVAFSFIWCVAVSLVWCVTWSLIHRLMLLRPALSQFRWFVVWSFDCSAVRPCRWPCGCFVAMSCGQCGG